MPFTKKSGGAAGKKQRAMPGPNSAAYKKIVAGRSGGRIPSSSGQSGRKARKASAAFSTLKSRQMIVERVRRTIWASVLEINDSIIALALAGNYLAAKALFDFAGVYTLPAASDEAGTVPAGATAGAGGVTATGVGATAAVAAESEDGATARMDAFFKSIGVQPPCDEPEPEGSTHAAL